MNYEIETRVIEEQPTAAMFATLAVDEIGPWLGQAYGTVAEYLGRFGVGPVGMPYARYRRAGDATFEVEAGFAATTPVPGEGEVEPSEFTGGKLAVTVHMGPYDEIEPAYDAIRAWIAERGGTPVGDPWELYFSDPNEVPDPAQWRTEVVQPYVEA